MFSIYLCCYINPLHLFWSFFSLFDLKLFFFFSVLFFIFSWQYCGGCCHTSTWTRHGCTCVPHPEPLSHFPPHPSAPAPCTLYHALNLDWRFISHVIIYMFQCHSPKSSHPRLFPQSPKDCSIHLCLFCCSYHLSKFHIYALVYCIGVFPSGLLHSV